MFCMGNIHLQRDPIALHGNNESFLDARERKEQLPKTFCQQEKGINNKSPTGKSCRFLFDKIVSIKMSNFYQLLCNYKKKKQSDGKLYFSENSYLLHEYIFHAKQSLKKVCYNDKLFPFPSKVLARKNEITDDNTIDDMHVCSTVGLK